jgi:hypothetical protein
MSHWHCGQEALHDMMRAWLLSNTLMQLAQLISHNADRQSYLVGKLSASRWHVPLPLARQYCSWMNPCRQLMPPQKSLYARSWQQF